MKKIFTFGILIAATFLVLVVIFVYLTSISNTNTSSQNDSSVSVWNAEAASFIKYESYEEFEKALEKIRTIELAEYNNAIKGTIVEQVQNIAIPSYSDEKQFANLQQGKILIEAPASEEFPEGVSLWAANLEKNKSSFVIGDFNEDGLNNVAHIIGYTGFGSGYFYHLMIFVNDHGELKYLTDE